MDLNEYQKLAMRTKNPELNSRELRLNAAMGLSGESGELIDLFKKNMFQGHELNIRKVVDELSDILWYCAEMSEGLGMALSEIAEHNIAKLKKRYPDGFDSEKSIHREE